jgi:signal transduction histidine kinase
MAVTLAAAGAAAGGPVVAWLAGAAGADLRQHVTAAIDRAAAGAHDTNRAVVQESVALFDEGVRAASSAVGRELLDRPFGLHGVPAGAETSLKAEIGAVAARVEARAADNVRVVGEVFTERAGDSLRAALAAARAAGATDAARSGAALAHRSAWLGTMALGLVVVAGTGLLFVTVLRPLRALEEVIGRLAAGEFAARVASARRDEIGRLGRGVDHMADEIQRGRAALVAANAALEWRVAARTAELQAALASQRAITERLEQALAELHDARYRLVRAARVSAVGALSAGVAHEFGNVLGGIAGTAEEAAAEAPDPDTREALAVIGRTARRGYDTARRLLEGAQSRKLEPVPVDLAAAAAEACDLLAVEAATARVRVVRDLAGPALVRADAGDLQQVALNLVRNALRAAGAGGQVTVVARVEGDACCLEVRDSGPGIPPERRATLFDPFAPGAPAAGGEGAGLGLFIVEAIVSAHRGTIAVDAAAEGGARFTVRFARLAP